jgi:hypothetical protein
MSDQEITREQLLAMTPAELLGGGLRRTPGGPDTGLAEELAGTGALALGEQVRNAGEPRDALALCMVALDQVREKVRAGAALTDENKDALARGLALQSQGLPVLSSWMDALRERIADRADLDAAIDLLERAYRIWQLNDSLRATRPPSP